MHHVFQHINKLKLPGNDRSQNFVYFRVAAVTGAGVGQCPLGEAFFTRCSTGLTKKMVGECWRGTPPNPACFVPISRMHPRCLGAQPTHLVGCNPFYLTKTKLKHLWVPRTDAFVGTTNSVGDLRWDEFWWILFFYHSSLSIVSIVNKFHWLKDLS